MLIIGESGFKPGQVVPEDVSCFTIDVCGTLCNVQCLKTLTGKKGAFSSSERSEL